MKRTHTRDAIYLCHILLGIQKQDCPDCKTLSVNFRRSKWINPSVLPWHSGSWSSVLAPARFVTPFIGLIHLFLVTPALHTPQPPMFTDPMCLIHSLECILQLLLRLCVSFSTTCHSFRGTFLTRSPLPRLGYLYFTLFAQ